MRSLRGLFGAIQTDHMRNALPRRDSLGPIDLLSKGIQSKAKARTLDRKTEQYGNHRTRRQAPMNRKRQLSGSGLKGMEQREPEMLPIVPGPEHA